MARNTEPTDTAIVDDSVETLPEDEAATSDTVIAVYDVNAVIAALGRPGKEADKGLYAGIVSDELVAACNEDGPTYAVSQTLRNEFGQPRVTSGQLHLRLILANRYPVNIG